MSKENEELEYDKHMDFYFTNLVNSLILFSLTKEELEKLRAPDFDPMFELESEIDYAFTTVCFDTIFRNKLIDIQYRYELLQFKEQTDNIPKEIWDWDFIDSHMAWIDVRKKANELLDKIGINGRAYNEDYTTIYDSKGTIIKKGKKL